MTLVAGRLVRGAGSGTGLVWMRAEPSTCLWATYPPHFVPIVSAERLPGGNGGVAPVCPVPDRRALNTRPLAALIYVRDGVWLLRYPEATYEFVVRAARTAEPTVPGDAKTLHKRLAPSRLTANGGWWKAAHYQRLDVWIG